MLGGRLQSKSYQKPFPSTGKIRRSVWTSLKYLIAFCDWLCSQVNVKACDTVSQVILIAKLGRHGLDKQMKNWLDCQVQGVMIRFRSPVGSQELVVFPQDQSWSQHCLFSLLTTWMMSPISIFMDDTKLGRNKRNLSIYLSKTARLLCWRPRRSGKTANRNMMNFNKYKLKAQHLRSNS